MPVSPYPMHQGSQCPGAPFKPYPLNVHRTFQPPKKGEMVAGYHPGCTNGGYGLIGLQLRNFRKRGSNGAKAPFHWGQICK